MKAEANFSHTTLKEHMKIFEMQRTGTGNKGTQGEKELWYQNLGRGTSEIPS